MSDAAVSPSGSPQPPASSPQPPPLTCEHCALPIPPGDLVSEEIDGAPGHFCCQGCRGAYLIITGAGLGRFYRQRSWQEPGLPEGAFADPYDDAYLVRFVEHDGDGR